MEADSTKSKNITTDLDVNLNSRDLYIAFYHGNYNLTSRAIKWWTKGKFSHCEAFLSGISTDYDERMKNGTLIGISSDCNVRQKLYDDILNEKKWVLVKVPEKDKDKIWKALNEFYDKTKGSKYDWKGIFLSNFLNRREHRKDRYTCSEWVINVLDTVYDDLNPKWYILHTPQDVYDYIVEKRKGE